MLSLRLALSMPTPLPAFPWGSMSTRRVLRSATAREEARFTAVVVLPTPPFWLAMQMILAIVVCSELSVVVQEGSKARDYKGMEISILSPFWEGVFASEPPVRQ